MKLSGTAIVYHSVGDCPRDDDPHNLFIDTRSFTRQMSFLARRRSVVALADLLDPDLRTTRPAVAITFDDAYTTVLTTAAPVLRRHRFPATIFVPTQWVGRRNEWDDPTRCNLEILDEHGLLRARDLGFELASHGHAHMNFEHANFQEARTDFAASIDRLRSIAALTPRYVAYTYQGMSSSEARRAAEAVGFDAAFSIDQPGEGRYSLERVQITRLDGMAVFALKTSGRYMGLRQSWAVRRGYALVRPMIRHRRPRLTTSRRSRWRA